MGWGGGVGWGGGMGWDVGEVWVREWWGGSPCPCTCRIRNPHMLEQRSKGVPVDLYGWRARACGGDVM